MALKTAATSYYTSMLAVHLQITKYGYVTIMRKPKLNLIHLRSIFPQPGQVLLTLSYTMPAQASNLIAVSKANAEDVYLQTVTLLCNCADDAKCMICARFRNNRETTN